MYDLSELLVIWNIFINSPCINILLEWQSSGSPPSAFRVPYDSFRKQGDCSVADGSEPSDVNTTEETNLSDLDYEFMCFFLSIQRLDLYRSLDYRCEEMLLGISWTGNKHDLYMNPIHSVVHSSLCYFFVDM